MPYHFDQGDFFVSGLCRVFFSSFPRQHENAKEKTARAEKKEKK